MNILPMTEVDRTTGLVRTAVPATYPLGPPNFANFPDGTVWIENVLEALDEPGEWVLDTAARKLYLWPRDGKQPGADVAAPRLTELIRVEGKIDYDGPSDTPVRGLVFRGLTFTQADRWPWEAEKTGWGLQHDWEIHDCMQIMGDGNAIYVSGTGKNNRVLNNFVHDIPAQNINASIRCDDDQHETTIENNVITRVCGEGVIWKGNNTIRNNILYDIRDTTPDSKPCVHQRGYLVLSATPVDGSIVQRNILVSRVAGQALLFERTSRHRRRPNSRRRGAPDLCRRLQSVLQHRPTRLGPEAPRRPAPLRHRATQPRRRPAVRRSGEGRLPARSRFPGPQARLPAD